MSDLIDRQAAIDAINKALNKVIGGEPIGKCILENLPSAQPERKNGEWVDFSMSIKGVPTEACGECGEWSYGMGKNFCPNCGADMRQAGKDMRGDNNE